ncbi:hypothetical protein OKW45_000428 [Paraburkholderia sp. WSM4175]
MKRSYGHAALCGPAEARLLSGATKQHLTVNARLWAKDESDNPGDRCIHTIH